MRPAFLVLAVTALLASLPVGAAQAPAPTLTLPDGTVIPLPPGARAFGPEGPQAPDAGPPPVPPVAPPPAQTRKQALDGLFDRLAKAVDEPEADAISARIAAINLRSGSDTADLLMARVMTAMAAKNNDTARALLDKLVVLQPRWAEAWNKRATLRFLGDDDVGAMADVGHVLALEPRHVGALSGMGMILHRNGEDRGALTVLRAAARINPQDKEIRTLIETITPDVEGRPL